jgi:hypothetical protein
LVPIVIGFIIFIANFILLCANYVIAIVNVSDSIVSTTPLYIGFFIVFPIIWWLYSTKEDAFNFYERKNLTLRLVIVNALLVMSQAPWTFTFTTIVYRICNLPVGRNFDKEMILNLCRIALCIPSLGFVAIGYSVATKILEAEEVAEGINTFRWQHVVDDRKNITHLYDLQIVRNLITGKKVFIKEVDRFVHMFIVGQSGTGKTSSTLIPAIICDLNKKLSNMLERTVALEKMIKKEEAVVEPDPEGGPIDEYCVKPAGKTPEEIQRNADKLNKIRHKYPDCGLTIMAPNNTMNIKVIELGAARGQTVNVIDPAAKYDNPNVKKVGLNPFYLPHNITAREKQVRIINAAESFSKALVAVTEVQGTTEQYFKDINTSVTTTIGIICMLNASLLGKQTNMKEIQQCIQDFGLLRPMIAQILDAFHVQIEGIEKEQKKDKNKVQSIEKEQASQQGVGASRIKYLEITDEDVPEWFNGTRIEYREYLSQQADAYYPHLFSALTELLGFGFEKMYDQSRGLRNIINNLMTDPRISEILCAPDDSVFNFDRALQNNEITVVNTALEIGAEPSTAIGIFFMLNMKNAVMRRARIPEADRSNHFITIDEASQYMHPMYEDMFALFRQYRVAVTLSLQTSSQMDKSNVTRYLKGVVMGAGIHIVFGRANSDEMRFYENLAGMENKETIQTQLNSNSEFDENYNVTSGQRVTVTREAALEGSQIRIRDFQEVSVFMVDRGRVLKGFIGKMNFPKKSEYAPRKNTEGVSFVKYCSQAEPDDQKKNEAEIKMQKEAAKNDVRKFATSITSSERQDNYISGMTSLPEIDGKSDRKQQTPLEGDSRKRAGLKDIYLTAVSDDSVFDKDEKKERDRSLDREDFMRDQEERMRIAKESEQAEIAGSAERLDPVAQSAHERKNIKKETAQIIDFARHDPYKTNFSEILTAKEEEKAPIPELDEDDDLSDEDIDKLLSQLDSEGSGPKMV